MAGSSIERVIVISRSRSERITNGVASGRVELYRLRRSLPSLIRFIVDKVRRAR